MSKVSARNGKLYFDFRYQGERYKEYSSLEDTPANRKRMEAVLLRIDRDIQQGCFDHAHYFSKAGGTAPLPAPRGVHPGYQVPTVTPVFVEYVTGWMQTKQVEWRNSYRESVEHILQKHLLPAFAGTPLHQIDRQRLLDFRAQLAAPQREVAPGRKSIRAAATVNRIMGILSLVLDEAAITYGLQNPYRQVKRLKAKRVDIQPFSLEEVRLLIANVREDYADYLRVRFFTGLRSGEVNGLKWEHVDFARREIKVRETLVRGRREYTKTDGSQREIRMSPPVYEAMKRMEAATRHRGEYVFCTQSGLAIENHNFVNRVWNPLLRRLGLKVRRPYQMRHTCATLWLAAGENPEWIARQLGHTTTQMLFMTYSRYVPNLTRKDGSAFDRMLGDSPSTPDEAVSSLPADAEVAHV